MGDLFLTIYVCSYVRTWYVRTYRNMSRSGMLIGMLRVSCRPIEFYLLRGLDGVRTTTFRNRSVDERAVLQGLQSWSSYIWSQTVSAVDICLYRDSTIVSRTQRLGYKRAGPSGLAELEQLHVESNSECNRHVCLSSSLANSLLVRDVLVSTWPGCACGRSVLARQLCGYVFLVLLFVLKASPALLRSETLLTSEPDNSPCELSIP